MGTQTSHLPSLLSRGPQSMGTSVLPVVWVPALSLPPALTQHVSLSLLPPHCSMPFLHHSLFSLSLTIHRSSFSLFCSLSHPLPPRWLFYKHLFEAVKWKWAWEKQELLRGSGDSLTGSLMTTGENCFVNCPISVTSVNTWAKKTTSCWKQWLSNFHLMLFCSPSHFSSCVWPGKWKGKYICRVQN